MVMVLWRPGSTYHQLFPHLINGKGGTCILTITPSPEPSVGRRSLKAIQEGHQELIILEFLSLNTQFKFPLELRPTSGVPIILRLLGNLTKSQGRRIKKRIQPNTGRNGRHLGGIIRHTSSGEGLGEQQLG